MLKALFQFKCVVEYDRDPIVKPGEDFHIRFTLKNIRKDAHYYTVETYLPEGWSADYNKTTHVSYYQRLHQEAGLSYVDMVVHVGEKVDAVNRFPVIIQPCQHAVPIMVPVVLLG